MRRLYIAVLAAAFLPSAAQADWQYTKWGMTPDQVIAASKGAAAWRKGEDHKGVTKDELAAPYKAGDRAFDAEFSFKDNKLVLVSLSHDGYAQCHSLVTDLKSTYGEPIDQSGGMFPTWDWDDKPNKNRLQLMKILDSCLLQYQPLAARNQGL